MQVLLKNTLFQIICFFFILSPSLLAQDDTLTIEYELLKANGKRKGLELAYPSGGFMPLKEGGFLIYGHGGKIDNHMRSYNSFERRGFQREVKKEIFVERYDLDCQFVSRYFSRLRSVFAARNFLFIQEWADNLYFFSMEESQAAKKNRIVLQAFDKEKMEAVDEPKEMFSVDIQRGRRDRYMEFLRDFSIDQSQLMMLALPSLRGQDQLVAHIAIINNSLKLVMSRTFTFPYLNKNLSVRSIVLGKGGKAHILVEHVNGNSSPTGSNPKYEVYTFLNETAPPIIHALNYDSKVIKKIRMQRGKNGQLILAGLYSGSQAYRAGGSFSVLINPLEAGSSTINFHPYDDKLIFQDLPRRIEKAINKNIEKGRKAELEGVVLSQVVMDEVGNTYIIAEQENQNQKNVSNGNSSSQIEYTFFQNNLTVSKISPKGELLWHNKIKKRQFSKQDGGISTPYALSFNGETLYFIFMNDEEYEKKEKSILSANIAYDYKLVIVSLDKDGRRSKTILDDFKDRRKILQAIQSGEASENAYVIYLVSIGEAQLMKLKLKD